MACIFNYNNKLYQCLSLDKKLKKLRINKEDIQIIFEGELTKEELETKFLDLTKETKETKESETINKYYFKNKVDKSIITSIYPTLDDLKEIININEYEVC